MIKTILVPLFGEGRDERALVTCSRPPIFRFSSSTDAGRAKDARFMPDTCISSRCTISSKLEGTRDYMLDRERMMAADNLSSMPMSDRAA